ncbi:hypothetical protein CC80DRAFT_592376 [Byssothecium circinans]|uniref:tRNA/rRNA methyltransferase SpoU type domain-containing protein n=1 Tax=Byssothecium circinans TaxID=147558 RepID=A0A6A5U240_9PLEO|nr:hypothetical protein CC80DRAFT_592376 [Byssothecium circinans]
MAPYTHNGVVQNAAVEAILHFSDETTSNAAFDHYWQRLSTSPSDQIDLGALRICVQLLPSRKDVLPYEELRNYIVTRIPVASNSAELQYLLAEICLSNTQLGSRVFTTLVQSITQNTSFESGKHDALEESRGRDIVAQLNFIKASFWIPPAQQHYLTVHLLHTIVKCVGIDGLDKCAHNALSALLSLLSNRSVVSIDQEGMDITPASASSNLLQQRPFLNNSLFARFEELAPEYFTENAGPAFRTWFQWITYTMEKGSQLDAVYSSFYWATLRTGLVTGFADQRKYCLGILQQSLLLPKKNIDTIIMQMDVSKRAEYISQYDRFSTLFEILVLDRYANQVLACLPELSALLGPDTVISPNWTTALLSAALSSKIQDGIRKLVGNWYLGYIAGGYGSVEAYLDFFVEGFLPWATQGNLFNSTLSSTRAITNCTHGEALANAVSRLVVSMATTAKSKEAFRRILEYVLDTGGNIFSPSVPYLLEGLIHGLKLRPLRLETRELKLTLRISRLSSLPEVTADLLTFYCAELTNYVDAIVLREHEMQGYKSLSTRYNVLEHTSPTGTQDHLAHSLATDEERSLKGFIERLHVSKHKIIQNEAFGPACGELLSIFERTTPEALPSEELLEVLDALWEEADRLEYPRPIALNIPPVFFHTACIRACVLSPPDESNSKALVVLLQKVLRRMQQFSEGRSYLLPVLGSSIRKACLSNPCIVIILPIEDFLVQFINNPPLPKKEFLFEVIAAQKLESRFPHRDYASYYGQREWYGYAAIIDLLLRFPKFQTSPAGRVLDRILKPWRTQTPPILAISKWKNVLQLQAMLLLTESCISEEGVDEYLDGLMEALVVEQWPRYRFLLEWIITRIYYHFPKKAEHILTKLAKLNENSPVQVASLMKLALLAAPFLDSEDFALRLMIQLIPFSASPKVQIRHEAHWSTPTIFGLAKERGWLSITENPAFQALDKHIRGLEKFITPPLTIRTMKLDAVKDFTLTNIFQGQYLRLETPELERVAYEDFESIYAEDRACLSGLEIPPARVPLGDPISRTEAQSSNVEPKNEIAIDEITTESNSTFFQTKSGFDIASLLPSQGPPSAQQKRPASVVLVASLIDNPTNIGGLSRISESFGLEALYIDDLKKTAHKDFKATSVTSEKHFPIRELKVPAIPDFLISMKRNGYEIMGIEQTDRSGMLGEESGGKGVGTLPKKCVLVLGSERGGITSEVLAVIDRCVEIKTVGVTRSLNVQTAGGIAVYEWWREWGGKE